MDELHRPDIFLVTGATGFVGQALIKFLVDKGWALRATTRDLSHPMVAHYPMVDWRQMDLTQEASLKNVCDGVSVVFHLAGFAHANNDAAHEPINYQGTVALAKEAVHAKVKRFIFFSTIKADSSDAYGSAKQRAETALLNLETPMISVVLRLSLVYGPHWKGNLAAMLSAIEKNRFPPPPRIQNKKSLVSLHDVCRVAYLAATQVNLHQQIFIVTDGQCYATYELYQWMRAALGKKPVRFYWPLWVWRLLACVGDKVKVFPLNNPMLAKLLADTYYDARETEQILGFKPERTFRSELPAIIEAARRRA